MPEVTGEADYLEQMPSEMIQSFFEYLSPQELQNLRSVSWELNNQVDNYVNHLIDSNQLVNDAGQPPTVQEPSQALAMWAGGDLGTSLYPIVPQGPTPEAMLEKYDPRFSTYPMDYNWHHAQLDVIQSLIDAGGFRSLEFRQELETYVAALLEQGRLVTFDDRDPLPADTDVDTAIQLWRQNSVYWLPARNA